MIEGIFKLKQKLLLIKVKLSIRKNRRLKLLHNVIAFPFQKAYKIAFPKQNKKLPKFKKRKRKPHINHKLKIKEKQNSMVVI
jgi:hypothetical protein